MLIIAEKDYVIKKGLRKLKTKKVENKINEYYYIYEQSFINVFII